MTTIRERVEQLAVPIARGIINQIEEGQDLGALEIIEGINAGADLAMRLIVEELRSEEAMVFQLEHEERNQDWVVIPPGDWADWIEARWKEKGEE